MKKRKLAIVVVEPQRDDSLAEEVPEDFQEQLAVGRR
jgi:hypothetical protein